MPASPNHSPKVASPLILDRAARIDVSAGIPPPAGVDLSVLSPDARALDRIGIETALQFGVLPLRSAGAITPVAAPSVQAFRRAAPMLEHLLGPVACCLSTLRSIEAEITKIRAPTLSFRASRRTPPYLSSRNWSGRRVAAILVIAAATFAGISAAAPGILATALTVWAALTLILVTGLRTLAAIVELRHTKKLEHHAWTSHRALRQRGAPLPHISMLVPLYREHDIAARLIARLARLDYPKDKLDVLLILEAGDATTEAALAGDDLPPWMRIVRVPPGVIQTKPRAMNYALDFARGEIIGIYDAEDAPAPDQLLKVAEAFRTAGPEVACLQGVLDFYNAQQSWLTRCFAIDYAVWFRLVLPGLVRMGFPIPLGGTTMFIRRDTLEKIGRWDAHNVTEDADLGLRLARHGYRVHFVPTVTREEATATIPAWLCQRSRWIKGYAVTWAVHMRDPLRLLGELGLRRFLGVQILFLGTLSQFVLAPFLWSFWLVLFGLPHPVSEVIPWCVMVTLGGLFLLSEVATLATAALSVATPRHRWLIKWVLAMHLYFPLAAIASWKGFAELISKPFYWDKTSHGQNTIPR